MNTDLNLMKKNELKVASILSIITLIISSLIQIFYTPIYIKYLGKSDYGIMSLFISLISYLILLTSVLENVGVRYILKIRDNKNKEDEKVLNGMFLLISLFITFLSLLILLYIYKKIPEFFKYNFSYEEILKTKNVFFVVGINLLFLFSTTIFSANIILREKFIYQYLLILLIKMLNPIIGTILMMNGFGMNYIIGLFTLNNFIIVIFNIVYSLKLKLKFSFKNLKWEMLGSILLYTFFIFINMVITQVNWEVDRVIIGRYIGTVSIGIYSLASVFIVVYRGLSEAISKVLFPKINNLVIKNDDGKIQEIFIRIGRYQYMLLGLCVSGFIIFGKEFLSFWLGSGYEEIYTVVVIILIPMTVVINCSCNSDG